MDLLRTDIVQSEDTLLTTSRAKPFLRKVLQASVLCPFVFPKSCFLVGEEQLPFAIEAREHPPWAPRAGRAMQRVDSEPPTPVSRQVLVRQPGPQNASQPLFQGQAIHSIQATF